MRGPSLAVLAFVVLASCATEASAPTDEASLSLAETELAVSLAYGADSAAQRQRSTMDLILRAFYARLRQADDPQARALLAESRALADSGRAAVRAGDRQAARGYFEAAHRKLFDAVALVLPEAAARTGAHVDTVVARMEARLDTAAAPRIRSVLAFVEGLRARADSALAAGESGRALAFNVRAMETLRAMQRHLLRPGGEGLPGDQGHSPPPPSPGDIPLPRPVGAVRPTAPEPAPAPADSLEAEGHGWVLA